MTTKKTEAAEAAALASRAQKLLQQTKAKNKALLDRSTRTKAVSQPAPAPRRHMAKPQPATESPLPPRPAVMRGESEMMSFPEREEREFIFDGGTFMATTVALLLAAGRAAAADADDEGEAE